MSAILNVHPAGFAINGIYAAIKAVYHIADDINTFINEHIEQMKASDNQTISRTGRILEGAKFGFGIGYTVPITIIALGQFLMGATKASLATLGTTATFSNPIAMTCAAVGAIYYGWNALSEQEKLETIERLRNDLDVGAELVKSIVHFVISKTKELLSSDNLRELKEFITASAKSFGRTLGDVTGAIKDRVVDTYHAATEVAGDARGIVINHAAEAFETVKAVTAEAGNSVANKLRKSPPKE